MLVQAFDFTNIVVRGLSFVLLNSGKTPSHTCFLSPPTKNYQYISKIQLQWPLCIFILFVDFPSERDARIVSYEGLSSAECRCQWTRSLSTNNNKIVSKGTHHLIYHHETSWKGWTVSILQEKNRNVRVRLPNLDNSEEVDQKQCIA